MSETDLHLEVESRTVTGKAVKHLRSVGYVPAVIHDHGKASLNVQAPYQSLRQLYLKAGKHHPISLKAGSHTYTALIKSVTFEPKKNLMTHVVFNAVKRNQKVETEVPVRPRYAEGNDASPAERAGLIILTQLDAVEIRAVPDKIPDVLYFNGEALVNEGDQVTVADLEVPKDVEIITPLDHSLATAESSAALQAENDAAGGTTEEAVDEQSVGAEDVATEADEQAQTETKE